MKQNVYDNAEFFSQYLNARARPESYNTLYEIPCMENLLPNVKGLELPVIIVIKARLKIYEN